MVEKYGYKNPHQIPQIEKITLNMGVGSAIGDKKILDLAVDCMTEISGQKPVITIARKSIANFRLREGMPIGCMVTLRRQRMYEFLDRLISIVLPRVRDFRGINRKAFDGRGNYTLGLDRAIGVSGIESGQIHSPARDEYHDRDVGGQQRRSA